MKTNVKTSIPAKRTHNGAVAARGNPEQLLRRSVMSCLLWEKEFYEEGEDIAERIAKLICQVSAPVAASIAVSAREEMKLRHIPLYICRVMAKLGMLKAETLSRVIQRPDEITEFLALYWKNGKEPLSAQVKKGLAAAFLKFNEYSLAKYDREGDIRLRDVLFLVHAKPANGREGYDKKARKKKTRVRLREGEKLFKKIVDRTLDVPDTWEVELSKSEDKKESWTRLLKENKLGSLALLRNLRNMKEAKVAEGHIRKAIKEMDPSRVLPFRFIAASRFAPEFEPELEAAMLLCTKSLPRLVGETVLLVDISGSMEAALSGKSDMRRVDAAAGLAIVLRELCDDIKVVVFGSGHRTIPARQGFALRDVIVQNVGGGTDIGSAVKYANSLNADRIVVITDEQSDTEVGRPNGTGYMLNVASAENGVGHGPWVRLNGFSESVVSYIAALEEE